jgi:serine/threonine protein kinase
MYISRYGRGTPGYRAPELEFFVSISRFNNKVDIWALGCILYEIVFKQRPFQNQYEVKDFADGRKSLKFPDSRGICDDSKLGKFTLEVLHLDPGKRPGIKELLVGIEEVFAPVERKPREIVAKGNEIRQRHPPPGGIRGLNQGLSLILS